MAKEKKQSRKDSKGRVLRKGESERKDGTYMYRYMDECKKRHSVYAKTLPELREKEATIEKDKMDDIRVSTEYTVDQMIQFILKICTSSKDLALTTQCIYSTMYELHIKNTWLACKKIKEVTNSDIKLFYMELSESLSNSTIHSINGVLNSAFDQAVKDHLIRTNPTYEVLKLFPKQTKEKIILRPYQIENLLDFVKNNKRFYKWHPIIVIMLETMIRGSELCGLTWNDVDLKHRVIKIDHQVQYRKINGKYIFFASSPKTKKGCREIPLTDKAYDAFIEQKKIQFSLQLYSKIKVGPYENFVFPAPNGKPYYVIAINSTLRNMVTSYNNKNSDHLPNLTCHVFRHTGCTIMAKKMFKLGLDPKILQQWMGHSSIQMTLELYHHALEEDSIEAMAEINKMTI